MAEHAHMRLSGCLVSPETILIFSWVNDLHPIAHESSHMVTPFIINVSSICLILLTPSFGNSL